MELFRWIANMPGPEFIFVYGMVIAVTLLLCWRVMRALDPTAVMPVPRVPIKPDPYEIAYLRGGENNVARVAVVSLAQRGYLWVTKEKEKGGLFSWVTKGSSGLSSSREQRIERMPDHPDARHLNPLERRIFDYFSSPHTASEVFKPEGLAEVMVLECARYEQRLQTEKLLATAELKDLAWKIGLAGGAVIVGLGGFKFIVALSRGRPNVLFLIIMGIVAVSILVGICRQRLSTRGSAHLKELEQAFEGLKGQTFAASPTADTTLPLLMGLFGVAVLAGTPFEVYQQMFRRQSSGGCGGGCGGGCDGGCGGCGE